MLETITAMKRTLVSMPIGSARSYMLILDENNLCTSILLPLCSFPAPFLLLSCSDDSTGNHPISMTRSHIPDALVKLTQTLNESPELRMWFVSLKSIPFSDRVNAFHSIAGQMREEGQNEEIINAVSSLVHPEIYQAVLNTVLE